MMIGMHYDSRYLCIYLCIKIHEIPKNQPLDDEHEYKPSIAAAELSDFGFQIHRAFRGVEPVFDVHWTSFISVSQGRFALFLSLFTHRA